MSFQEKVLDITDAEVSEKLLPRTADVNALSFNQYAGYLLHKTTLAEVKIMAGQA